MNLTLLVTIVKIKFDDNPNASNKLFNQSGTKFFFKSNIVAKIENKIVTII